MGAFAHPMSAQWKPIVKGTAERAERLFPAGVRSVRGLITILAVVGV
jgi:hypothetical protein